MTPKPKYQIAPPEPGTPGTLTIYHVFHRTWWTTTPDGRRTPGPGPKTTIAYCATEDDAYEQAVAWNLDHTPGPNDRRAEYRKETWHRIGTRTRKTTAKRNN